MSMRRTEIAIEARRNLLSGVSRAVLFAGVWAIGLGAAVVCEVNWLAAVVHSSDEFRAGGGDVTIIVATDHIDGARCTELGRLPNVVAAGAIRTAESDLKADSSPRSSIPTRDVTGGILTILGQRSNDGLFFSREVAETFGYVRAARLGGHTVPVAGVFDYPDDGRRSGLTYSALQTVAATGSFDECWIKVWPESEQVLSLLAFAVSGGPDGEVPVILELNPSLPRSFDASGQLASRPDRLLAVGTAFIGATLGFVSVRLRRLELASARHVGVAVLDQAAQLSLESAAWNTASALVAVVVAGAVTMDAANVWPYLASAAVIVGTGFVAVFAGVLLAMATFTQAHFLRYFRER